ncbi:PIN domain-containing protein [Candidatus Woesearchaeota archaeon]|nr:PIN domain-containing protein [Candidatus Woesearchaeota archaeon]
MNTFFFDTYALIEMLKGNPNYDAYTSAILITGRLNLMELYYYFLRERNEPRGRKAFLDLRAFCVAFSDDELMEACHLRRTIKKASYVDALGYVLAKRCRARFLTGDPAFKGVEDVEFVV